eukprot:s1340_g11.t1
MKKNANRSDVFTCLSSSKAATRQVCPNLPPSWTTASPTFLSQAAEFAPCSLMISERCHGESCKAKLCHTQNWVEICDSRQVHGKRAGVIVCHATGQATEGSIIGITASLLRNLQNSDILGRSHGDWPSGIRQRWGLRYNSQATIVLPGFTTRRFHYFSRHAPYFWGGGEIRMVKSENGPIWYPNFVVICWSTT